MDFKHTDGAAATGSQHLLTSCGIRDEREHAKHHGVASLVRTATGVFGLLVLILVYNTAGLDSPSEGSFPQGMYEKLLNVFSEVLNEPLFQRRHKFLQILWHLEQN